jgi:hypothetical protein
MNSFECRAPTNPVRNGRFLLKTAVENISWFWRAIPGPVRYIPNDEYDIGTQSAERLGQTETRGRPGIANGLKPLAKNRLLPPQATGIREKADILSLIRPVNTLPVFPAATEPRTCSNRDHAACRRTGQEYARSLFSDPFID